MPLIIPKTLPAYDALYEENVFVMHRERAASQHIRPLEILILNLMPTNYASRSPPCAPPRTRSVRAKRISGCSRRTLPTSSGT